MVDDLTAQEFFWRKRPERVFVSPRIREPTGAALRIASRIIETRGGLMEAKEINRVVLREPSSGRFEIVAKLYEHSRKIFVLTIQKYNRVGGPSDKQYFSFVGSEITELLGFLTSVKRLHFATDEGFNVADSDLQEMLLSTQQVRRLVMDNQDAVAALAENEITTRDVVALGYRRRELNRFATLLEDPEFRAAESTAAGGPEKLWQAFFERNPWVFGYGLSYVFTTGLDGKRLEQVVRGHNLEEGGKRADGVMKTRALISSLCFVEIKHPDTPLLRAAPYRDGIWAPHADLAGAVAQAQGTAHAAVQTLRERIGLTTDEGDASSEEVFNVAPRSFLVVGSLAEFRNAAGVNLEKFRSFELLRRNTQSPEIITFDELHDRAKFIVDTHG